MTNLKDFEEKMTVFYRVLDGEIKCIASGVQNMDFFGKDKITYSTGEGRWDFIVVKKNDKIMYNCGLFKVVDGKIEADF